MVSKPRILIIEDDEEMCEELKLILEDENYQVDTVFDGADGIRAIEKSRYNLVLLDLKMPEMSGVEVLKRMHKDFGGVKVIVLTGSPIMEEISGEHFNEKVFYHSLFKGTALEPADRLFNKPFDIKELIKSIKELVGE